MKPPRPRLVVRLRLTLVGIEPAVWRDIIIDRFAPLSELHAAIQLAFAGEMDDHHVFRSAPAGGAGGARDESPAAVYDWSPFFSDDPYKSVRTLPPTRWGDRWTMIDLRDPTVEDESSVTVGHVMQASNPLFYSWQSERLWGCRIDAYEDAVLDPLSPRVALNDGMNRAPMSSCPDAATYDAWLRVLEDPDHDDHAALREMLDRAVGPWVRFDPAEFDLAEARSRFEDHFTRRDTSRIEGYWHQPPLEGVIRRLPASNQAGLRHHLQRSGVLMPAVITHDEAVDVIRPFRWLVAAAADQGIALADGCLPDVVVREAADSLHVEVDEIPPLVATAKQLGLLYLRRGRLHAPRAATDAEAHPVQLWRQMATQLLRRRMPGGEEFANTLFVLALADGTLVADDPDAVMSRIIAARELVDGVGGWPRSERRWRDWPLNLSIDREDEFDQPSPYERWRAQHSLPLVPSEETAAYRDAKRSRLFAGLAPLIRTLGPLGLVHDDDGRWFASDGLREFARAALR